MSEHSHDTDAWIGVDLDGVLAVWGDGSHFPAIGLPIPQMVERVKGWITEGKDVRIFTARVARTFEEMFRLDQEARIAEWSRVYLGRVLPITCVKDPQLIELWDDRCVQMLTDRGQSHTEVVAEFLNELYAIMVDPLAGGTMAVGAMQQALLDAAERDRNLSQALQSREAQILTLCSILGVEAEEDLELAVWRLAARGPIDETWNTCPDCGARWQDLVATPGLLHRTRLCGPCAAIVDH